MGFADEPAVRSSLVAAFGNADRAVDFLMNGIPEGALQAAMAHGGGRGGARGGASAPPPASSSASASAPSASGAGARSASGPLDQLRQHPQFNGLKEIIQSNPEALPQVLAQIGAASPELLGLINQHRADFIQMMQEPIEDEDEDEDEEGEEDDGDEEGGEEGGEGGAGLGGASPQMLAMLAASMAQMSPEQRAGLAQQMGMPLAQLNQLAQLHAMGGVGGGGGGVPPGSVSISLTADEKAAVDRLCGMGFPKNRVLEAYLACDKNEELAANYLLNSMDAS